MNRACSRCHGTGRGTEQRGETYVASTTSYCACDAGVLLHDTEVPPRHLARGFAGITARVHDTDEPVNVRVTGYKHLHLHVPMRAGRAALGAAKLKQARYMLYYGGPHSGLHAMPWLRRFATVAVIAMGGAEATRQPWARVFAIAEDIHHRNGGAA